MRKRNPDHYRPGMARVGEATPQSDPEQFTDDEIRAEIQYLLRLNKRHGTHLLRVQAYLALEDVLRARQAPTTGTEGTDR